MADVVQAQNRDPMDQSVRGSEPLAGRALPSDAHVTGAVVWGDQEGSMGVGL